MLARYEKFLFQRSFQFHIGVAVDQQIHLKYSARCSFYL